MRGIESFDAGQGEQLEVLARAIGAGLNAPVGNPPQIAAFPEQGLRAGSQRYMARDVLATYAEAQDLINIGAYAKGSNPKIDYAQSRINEVNAFLRQGIGEKADFEEDVAALRDIFADQMPTHEHVAEADNGGAQK